jgi:hypothetical protein
MALRLLSLTGDGAVDIGRPRGDPA